ncbi:uncharacterized protein BO95DRAFT_511747 [Aspergillus brunneoviolaceus CBS 621.78]|nr:hypothetical protein BO95DRAFT_511747 [Aspergillus brunneoviolaceus CBS 621.78]RAH49384.1 hypothetical protein BO95DRAFT_511747 [Aspergillus brunneoviolaceus CBS 621.78]
MPPAQRTKPADGDIEPNQMSQSKWLKNSGYSGLWEFGLSYGLKIHDPEDLAEAKQIMQGLRDMDQEEWEKKQKQKKDCMEL